VLALTAVLAGSAGARPTPSVQAASPGGLIAVCVNGDIWTDGGFEATNSTTLANPNYVATSIEFGTPLCNLGNTSCQDQVNTPPALNGPRTGNSWAWFGGNDAIPDGVAEIASAAQTVTIPDSSLATLSFFLQIGLVTAPFTDTLEVQVDGVTQQTFMEPGTAETSYTLRSIDLSAFTDGAAHVVKFLYTQKYVDPAKLVPNKANFDVDDVTLDIVCSPVTPASLSVDPIALGGNGVLEPGETVVVAPGYSNSSGSAVPLTGTASNFTGPAGATYAPPVDGTADYGSIPANMTKDCYGQTLDCYAMTAPSPVTRPAAHWDAKFDEALSTGGAKTWALHIGESFTDVPSSHPFYSYIENIFHNGITGGCGAGIYCPGNSVTRAQMAVFLLKSEHGSAYVPQGCAANPKAFGDVTCPSLYADWIEQLAAEGITSGCGGGNYCPDASVTRAQMAVFLLKTEYGSAYVPPACALNPTFGDVTCPSLYADWIGELAAEGTTGGCGNGNYCPNAPNTRGEMAVFLTRTFGLLLYGP
jgi:hypothetical protein